MRLLKAILIRLFFGLASLLFITFVVFVADELRPGNAALYYAGEKASAADVSRIEHNMGLDRPWPIRYVEFASSALKGDFGKSYFGTHEEVSSILQRDMPITLKIALCAIVLASAVGIFLGSVAAVKENRLADRSILTLSTLGVTLPNFVLAPLLVGYFALYGQWLPQDWSYPLRGPEIYYLILPVICMSLRPMATLTRLTRASMIDSLQQEYVRLAVAKGVPPLRLYIRHALRNAILPVVTSIGTSFGFLLTGSFVVERFFRLPGLGHEAIEAVQRGDMPVVMATVVVTGLLFITVNLIVDVLQPILDPRIREAQV